jgi:hypothetical protein
MNRHILFVILTIVSSLGIPSARAEMPVRVPERIVQVVHYVPSRQELQRLSTAGVEFLFVALAGYPDRFQARDLATFSGQLTVVIAAPTTPDNFQVMGLNLLKGPVWMLLGKVPDSFGVTRLNELIGDVRLYVRSAEYLTTLDVGYLNRLNKAPTLVISADYPDTYKIDRLAELNPKTRLVLNVNKYPDAWTVRTLNKLTRPTALYINKSSTPGNSMEAGYLSQLGANFNVFVGRVFSPETLLERLLIALENR